jgi:hypothetical protein
MRTGIGHPLAVLPQMGVFFFDDGQQRVRDLQG